MAEPKKKVKKKETGATHKVLTVVGVIMCIILIPILIINCTLILKSFLNKDEVPSVAGIFPLIVLTDSMYPEIHGGDLIICQSGESEAVKEGDIIAFFDPAGNGTSIVTHRVVEVVGEGDELSFRTKGDANNTEDKSLVPAEDFVGVYRLRIPGAGNIAMFMQSTTGLIVCVVLPIILLVTYDFIRRRRYEKNKKEDMDLLMKELEELKAEKARRSKQE